MCPAQVYEIAGEASPAGNVVTVEVTPSNCVQCGAITAKGGRLTPPEGGSGPEYSVMYAGRGHSALPSRYARPPPQASYRRTERAPGSCRSPRLSPSPGFGGPVSQATARRCSARRRSRARPARRVPEGRALQRTGSFKPRGLLAKLASLTPEESGAASSPSRPGTPPPRSPTAAALEGIDALVCMWQGASALKVAAVRGYGATVDQEAADSTEAFARAAEFAERDRAHVRPPVRRRHGDRGPRLARASSSSRTAPTSRWSSCRSAAAGSSPASRSA